MARFHETAFTRILDWHVRDDDGGPGTVSVTADTVAVSRYAAWGTAYTLFVTARASGRDTVRLAFVARGRTVGAHKVWEYGFPSDGETAERNRRFPFADTPTEPLTFPTLVALMRDAEARAAVIFRGQHHDTCTADCPEGQRYSAARRYA